MSYRARTVRSTQVGNITINGSASNTASLSTTVDKNYAVIELLGIDTQTAPFSPAQSCARIELTNGTTVTARVHTAPGAGVIVSFRVTEYFPYAMRQAVQHIVDTLVIAATTRGELFTGGFTSTDSGSPGGDGFLGTLTLTGSTSATRTGAAALADHFNYCVADWK